MSADELVCHVRNISKAQRLSFHYGTSEEPYGTMATFRLIGDRIELILLNDEKRFTYELGAYDLSDNGEAKSRAKKAFAAFRTALLERPEDECRQ
jgi:hypothetical protein